MSLSSAPHIATAEIAPAGMGWPKCIGYMLWCMLKPTRHDKAALLAGKLSSIINTWSPSSLSLKKPMTQPGKCGANRESLLYLYRSLIRSKLDYDSVVYGSARPSYIKMLDTIHHQGLRLSLGAFRTTPVESIYLAADEPSLMQQQALRKPRLQQRWSQLRSELDVIQMARQAPLNSMRITMASSNKSSDMNKEKAAPILSSLGQSQPGCLKPSWSPSPPTSGPSMSSPVIGTTGIRVKYSCTPYKGASRCKHLPGTKGKGKGSATALVILRVLVNLILSSLTIHRIQLRWCDQACAEPLVV
ncbi:hypothetical protein EGW08_019136 [Elysia chlorotica]|uniref:Uncharacterized protein n=1 Tax=Elysia chlorotica TaxID=188477 RepID=A0A3S1B223_ELYCH|nr:hypothetical protein EGW08_019136 [Elysia chlorotica]